MTFSSGVKAEICRVPIKRYCCAVSEAYGVLLFCNTFTSKEIKIITESGGFSARLIYLFKTAFGIEFDRSDTVSQSRKKSFVITDKDKIEKIFGAFGYVADKNIALHLNGAVLEDEPCRASFIRGAFLAGGSVTNPEKRYHLELATSHYNVSREVYALLLDMDFTPKEIMRKSYYLLYFKQSEFIEDFLTMIGAPVSALALMETKVEKDLRNDVNRRVNCDTANVTKTVDAALLQLEAIGRLKAKGELDTLPQKLKETARLRTEYPEAALSELALMFSPPVTKSCLNHRMRKIMEISLR